MSQELNNEQLQAVQHRDGPLLIIAGAGAGKTKTITHRILELIKNGVAPREILAITFTNKAAKEMRGRATQLIAGDSEINRPISTFETPFISTFHSLGVHILKENAGKIGLNRHFSIYDRADSKRAIKEAMENKNVNPKRFDPGKVLGVISRFKGDNINIQSFKEDFATDYFHKTVGDVWERYDEILKREKALDFDDLLLKTSDLLRNDLELRKKYQEKWKYIHIDEYQDTNRVQYMIAKLLAEKYENLVVVGDIDQNIYSWRGADIKNILNFEKDYNDPKIILLEKNYRSTKNILDVANLIIEKNVYRREKNLFTDNDRGEKIGLYVSNDETEEAYFIASRTATLIESGISPNEIAVLYRANFQSRILEEAFINYGIKYQLLGTRFFERKEVKDILSYIRAALNPESFSDIKRIINVPTRGIGKVTLLKIYEGNEDKLPAKMKEKYQSFKELLSSIKDYSENHKPSELIKYVMSETGIEHSFDRKSEEDQERLENLRELVTLASKYDIFEGQEGVEKLLEEAALQTDQDTIEDNRDGVKLMTVHASKGLEFDHVFIGGLEENLFPHLKLSDAELSGEESEEERRLFYVAITRARKKVILSFAQSRMIFGSRQVNLPSQFITDIDDGYLEAINRDLLAPSRNIEF